MSKNIISKSLVLGEVTLARLASIVMPAELAPSAKAIGRAYATFKAKAAKADDATVARKAAQAAVLVADSKVGASVVALAGVIVANDHSKRTSPLAEFGEASTTRLLNGSRRTVATRVAALSKKVAASKSPKEVRDAAVECGKAARALARAKTKLVPHQVAFNVARQGRDAALAAFTLKYETARQIGKRVWKGDAEQFATVFGPLEPGDYSPKRRPAPAAATTASSTSAAQAKTTTTSVAATASPLSTPAPSVAHAP